MEGQGMYVCMYVCMYANIYQRKLGSNLPSYGQCEFNEVWCATLHHTTMRRVRLHSMKGGV